MGKRRIFVAIDVSDEVRSRVEAYVDGLRSEFPDVKARWVDPQKLHLTLNFAGHIDPEHVRRLNARVADLAQRCTQFQMSIDCPGAFIKPNGSNVLWLGVKIESPDGAQRLDGLVASLNDDPGTVPKRGFKPHLTIARLKDASSARDLISRHLDYAFETARFAVDELVVYESELLPAGSRYTAIARYRLRGSV